MADICAEDSVVAVIEFRVVVETSGTDVATFDIWLLFVAVCDVIICAEVVMLVGRTVSGCGCGVGETNDVTSFCAVAGTCMELVTVLDACILDDVD